MLTHPVLQKLTGAGVRLGLDRIRGFLRSLGDPHLAAPVLHVAGTNGKGSVCAVASSVLRAHGLTVGTFTSPHLQRLNERIAVDGTPISDPQLSALLEEVEARAGAWAAEHMGELGEGEVPLTYYEAMTAAGFLHFARAAVDVAVVEVGLGGRLDATNVVQPTACAIVSVGLDHTAELGPDVASIAAEKAGILKPGVPVVVGPVPRDALRVIRSMAGGVGVPALIWGEDYSAAGRPRSWRWTFGERVLEELRVELVGQHQVENAGVALTAVAAMEGRLPGLQLSEPLVRLGLSAARHPGRCEWLAPDLLVDGAHNVDGARRLAELLGDMTRGEERRTLLLGVSEGKDVRSIAAALAPHVDRVLTTRCAHPRAMEPGAVAEALVGLSRPVMPAGPIEQALPLAREGGGVVIVVGSLFLVGAVRDLVGA